MSEVDDAEGIPVTAAATFCATLVDEWVARGMRHAVISPGSRSTPMAMALTAQGGRPRDVHLVLDERSAGFLALGLARGSGAPVAVLTTSGTATANLYPAVVEAHQDAVPLVLCTADRPPELHGVGAPQTIDQQHLYGSSVRAFIDAGVPEESDPATWRSLAEEVWVRMIGAGEDPPGPVHLNLPFREPLVGRAGDLPWPGSRDVRRRRSSPLPDGLDRLVGARALVVLGPPSPVLDRGQLHDEADKIGWPVVVDPRCGTPPGPEEQVDRPDGSVSRFNTWRRRYPIGAGVHRADLLLRSPVFAERARPDVVLRIGALPASKVLGTWLDGLDAHQIGIDRWGRQFDPGHSLDEVWARDIELLLGNSLLAPAPDGWLELWSTAEVAAEEVLALELGGGPLTEPVIARLVTEVARDQQAELVVSSSMPIRDVEWFGVPDGPAIHANRGANGIDGVTSTAAGVALGSGVVLDGGHRAFALLGDLAFLHDTNGLLILNSEQPDLTLVVVDNGGGGIFHFLPPREALDAERFEYLYGTPQNLDLVAVAEAHGVLAQRCDDREAFEAALRATTKGPRVLVVTTDRDANVIEHRRLQDLVVAAVDATLPPVL